MLERNVSPSIVRAITTTAIRTGFILQCSTAIFLAAAGRGGPLPVLLLPRWQKQAPAAKRTAADMMPKAHHVGGRCTWAPVFPPAPRSFPRFPRALQPVLARPPPRSSRPLSERRGPPSTGSAGRVRREGSAPREPAAAPVLRRRADAVRLRFSPRGDDGHSHGLERFLLHARQQPRGARGDPLPRALSPVRSRLLRHHGDLRVTGVEGDRGRRAAVRFSRLLSAAPAASSAAPGEGNGPLAHWAFHLARTAGVGVWAGRRQTQW